MSSLVRQSVVLSVSLSPNLSVCRDLCTRGRCSFVDSFIRSIAICVFLIIWRRSLGIVFACSSLRADAAKTPPLLCAYNLSLMRCFFVFVVAVAVAVRGGGGETKL